MGICRLSQLADKRGADSGVEVPVLVSDGSLEFAF
jgi:hypothetical protein